jgi:hypothetical protein
MASKLKYQFPLSYERNPVTAFLRVAIGAAGAPTLERGKGIDSITRSGAGEYDIVLTEKFYALLAFDAKELNAAAQDLGFQLTAVDTATRTVSFGCKDSSPAFADPANGSVLYLKLDVFQSSVE